MNVTVGIAKYLQPSLAVNCYIPMLNNAAITVTKLLYRIRHRVSDGNEEALNSKSDY